MIITYPCIYCNKSVRNNQNSILCVNCGKWSHAKCGYVNDAIFNSDRDWICSKCLFSELPTIDLFTETVEDTRATNPRNEPNYEEQMHVQYNNFDSVTKMVKCQPGINITHLNICSLYRCIDEVRSLFENSPYDVVSFSETMLDETIPDSCINIDGYSIIRKDRNRNGGGIIVYVKKDVIYKVRDDILDDELEMQFFKLRKEKSKTIPSMRMV